MDKLREKIEKRLEQEDRGYVFTRKDFQGLAPAGTIGKLLFRLAKEGKIRRLGRGLFDYPKTNPALGGELSPDIDLAAKAIARKFRWSILPYGSLAANRLGLSQQVPAKYVYLSNGPAKQIKIDKRIIYFKHARPKEIYADSEISGLVVQALRYLGKDNVSDSVIAHLKYKLSAEQKIELRDHIHYSAEWVYEFVQRIAKD
jgi:hypothetical protein